MLSEGDPAPMLTLPSDPDGELSLADLKGRWVVLYFYPKDATEGCTLEAREFSALAAKFKRQGVRVIGVSPDSLKSHAKFRAKQELDLTLASDEDTTAANAYGVWVEKKMYGRTFMGVERATFLIAPDGRIARIWRKVSAKGHAAQVLDAVAEAKRSAA